MNAQLTPNITLSTGRTVVHSRNPNGSQQANIAGPTGPEMTPDEWDEYCQRLVALNANQYDPRYAYVTCSQCRQKWQRIDYNCARHALICTANGFGPLPPQIEPMPLMSMTPEEWADFDMANGINQ